MGKSANFTAEAKDFFGNGNGCGFSKESSESESERGNVSRDHRREEKQCKQHSHPL